MYSISQEEFETLVGDAIDALPPQLNKHLQNVVFIVEDEPTHEQRIKLKLGPYQTLFGLYEGVPLVRRNGNSAMLLPDKITLFKTPLEHSSNSMEDLAEHVHRTVWHEVAHYYGLDHEKIEAIEKEQAEK